MLAFFLLVLSTLGGACLTLLAVRRTALLERIAMGVPLGMALFGLCGLALAHLLGLGVATLALSALASALPLLILRDRARRRQLWREWRRLIRLRRPRRAAVLWAVAALIGASGLFFFYRGALFVSADGNFETTNWANMGDVAYHIAIIEGFVRGENYPPEHPEFAGARLTYPFIVDFVAAQYVACGLRIDQALLLQNLALIFSLVYLLRRFAHKVTGSALAANLTVPLVLLTGGWGFLGFWSEVWKSVEGPLHTLMHLPRDFTNDAERGYRWGNMMTVLLGTQRSILLGIPTGLSIWLLWWRAKAETSAAAPPSPSSLRLMALAGALCGFLPLGHVHTFLVMGGVGGLWMLLTRRWRLWGAFFATLLLIGLPCIAFMLSQSQTDTEPFRRFHPGWDFKALSDEQQASLFENRLTLFEKLKLLVGSIGPWARLWLQNTGLTIPLLLLALTFPQKPSVVSRRYRRFYTPLVLCFLFANVIQLAPWPWDNIKVIIWCHLASIPMVAALLTRLWSMGGSYGWAWRLPVVISVYILTAAGSLDIWRVITGQATQIVYTAEERAFGDAIAQATPPRARLVTAPTFNSAAYLSGRRVLAGYYGHLWSHGLNSLPREEEMKAIYAGKPEAQANIEKWKADYLILGPHEREDKYISINEKYLESFPTVIHIGEHRLLRLRESVQAR